MFAGIFTALSHVSRALTRMGDAVNRFTDNLDSLNAKVEAQSDTTLALAAPADISTEPVNRIAETNGRKSTVKTR